jgi:NAD(P)-dependent dehydrogenase (short-subunit alcohol dehydrogenase family)
VRATSTVDAFAGRTVLVTGSGSNLGFAVARAFLDAGARVVISDRTAASTRTAGLAIPPAQRDRVLAQACDVSDPQAVVRLFSACDAAFGGLDVLVCNAAHLGVGEPETVEDLPLALFDQVVGVNLRGTFLCIREAIRRLRRSRGAIVTVGSNTSRRAIRGRACYIASKGGIEALTRALAIDLAPDIRINCVAPGYIRTSRWDGIGAAARRRRCANVPLGGPATAAQVASAILFLAGAGAASITGTRLVVDGGIDCQLVPASCQV